MSKHADDRAIEQAAEMQARIALHKCDDETLRIAKATLAAVAMDPEADNRARVHAAEFLMKHDWDVFEHEHPPVNKQEVTHTFPTAITLEVVHSTQEAPKP